MTEAISVSEERLLRILAEFKLDLLERLSRDLSAKANVADVDALKATVKSIEARVGEHETVRERVLPQFENALRDVEGLKQAAADASAVSRYKRAVWVVVIAAVGAFGGFVGYAIQTVS